MDVQSDNYTSPPWNRPTKITVAIASILLVLGILWRFQFLITPLVLGAILAYLLNPIIEFVNVRTHIKRSMVTTIVFILLALIVIGAVVVVGVAVYLQVVNLVAQIPEFIESAPETIEQIRESLSQPITIGTFTFTLPIPENDAIDWQSIVQQVLGYLQPVLSTLGTSLTQVALSTVGLVSWFVFVIFVGIYISSDIPRLRGFISDAADLPGYRRDAERLWRDFGRVWEAYLRGQAILGLVVGTAVAILLGLIGVENALALGVLSGLLEFIPLIGPLVGGGAAVIVALFQDSNAFGLPNLQFALIVLGIMILIQQVENNILVPRIVGDNLDLNPLVVFIGAIMGSSLGGILGAILAAPVIATLKLLGTYAWRKFFDLPPFPKPEPEPADSASWAEKAWERWQVWRASRQRNSKSPARKPSPNEPKK